MFRFSANPQRQEEVQDVLKGWGKLALAGMFAAGAMALPKAFAEPVQAPAAYQAAQVQQVRIISPASHSAVHRRTAVSLPLR